MPQKIIDEFSHLPVSHQRKTQLRYQRDGKCTICGQPPATKHHCRKHALARRDRERLRSGRKKPYRTFLDRVGPEIRDEFTDLPLPYTRKMFLRWKRDGLCLNCGEPRATKSFCLKHAEIHRELARKRNEAISRHMGALTYRLAGKRLAV